MAEICIYENDVTPFGRYTTLFLLRFLSFWSHKIVLGHFCVLPTNYNIRVDAVYLYHRHKISIFCVDDDGEVNVFTFLILKIL